MQKEMVGNVLLWLDEAESGGPGGEQTAADEETDQIQDIVRNFREEEYHDQITQRKSYTVMYQLAESRRNVFEWIQIPKRAKILELGAGCGTVTSVLLDQGAKVICQDENAVFCRMNALRHKEEDEGRLTVYGMSFEQCEPELARDFDVAVLTGLPAVEEKARVMVKKLHAHLKKAGLLVIAVENKFGLKYWAGNMEMHVQKYFAGLENDGVQLYSRRGLEKLLQGEGFLWQEFYYPYPDHRFARDIYSDKYLPKKGDLTYNITNYESDRLILFDEQKVFDSIIEEGQFPFFSNSYLCLASAEGRWEQQTVYARYATDRSREFAVRTDMADGSVYKRPVYREGNGHVMLMEKAYEQLSRQYRDTGLKFNRCLVHTDEYGSSSAEFEFIRGEALQGRIEQAAAAGDMKKVFDILEQMVQYIRNGSENMPFQMTEEFQRVFGEISRWEVLARTVCSAVSDIDLILPNILVSEDGIWNVIDYEWTFFFPIPQNFIIYRTLFFLHHQNPQKAELSMENLQKAVQITQEEAEIYEQMERGFQQYVTGAQMPYREMVNLMERKYWNVPELKANYDYAAGQNELLKGRIIWKAARKIKRKLTGN